MDHKPIKDWTLGEINAYCKSKSCNTCVFKRGDKCFISNGARLVPSDWILPDKSNIITQLKHIRGLLDDIISQEDANP